MYRVGDVVLVIFPYDIKSRYNKSPDFSKPRPGLILNISETTSGFIVYEVCQITHTDRSDSIPGIWLERGKKFYKHTGLLESSFFNLKNIICTTDAYIYRRLGFYGNMSEIKKIMDLNK